MIGTTINIKQRTPSVNGVSRTQRAKCTISARFRSRRNHPYHNILPLSQSKELLEQKELQQIKELYLT